MPRVRHPVRDESDQYDLEIRRRPEGLGYRCTQYDHTCTSAIVAIYTGDEGKGGPGDAVLSGTDDRHAAGTWADQVNVSQAGDVTGRTQRPPRPCRPAPMIRLT